jgi:hypothetical protein
MTHCGSVRSRLTLAVGARTPENLTNRPIKPVAHKPGPVVSPPGATPFLDYAGIGCPACPAAPLVRPPCRRPTTGESNSSLNLARAVIWRNGSFNRPRRACCRVVGHSGVILDCARGAVQRAAASPSRIALTTAPAYRPVTWQGLARRYMAAEQISGRS